MHFQIMTSPKFVIATEGIVFKKSIEACSPTSFENKEKEKNEMTGGGRVTISSWYAWLVVQHSCELFAFPGLSFSVCERHV